MAEAVAWTLSELNPAASVAGAELCRTGRKGPGVAPIAGCREPDSRCAGGAWARENRTPN